MVDTRRSFFVSKLITRRRWGFKSFGYKYLVETPWFFKRVFVFLSQFALLSFPTCSPFHITDYHSKPHDYLSFHLSLFFHRWPKLCESSLDFEFIRGGRQGMGWGFDCLCWTWGRAFNQFFFFRGRGYMNLSSPDMGPTWGWIWLPTRMKETETEHMFPHFHASRTRRTVWKYLEIMEANENKPKVSRFYCIDPLNLLRYCGIKVNGSKEKPSRFLQVQFIGVWLTCSTITI